MFLFRFAEFVEWPSDAFATPRTPITFGVLGTDPFGSALQQAVQGERISGRTLVVQQFRNVDEIHQCNVLFISRSESARLPVILASLKGRSILTVSDTGDFVAKGGMIQFVTEGNRVRFEINRDAAEAARLRLSAKLLRLSE